MTVIGIFPNPISLLPQQGEGRGHRKQHFQAKYFGRKVFVIILKLFILLVKGKDAIAFMTSLKAKLNC